MTDSQKSQNKQQRRWAVCRAKVKAGAFSAVVDIDSDSESEPDEGFGDDASRPSMLKASMSFSSQAIGTQPEEGEDSTTQSSCPSTAVTASTADLSVECATPVEGSTRSSAVSPDPIGISLSLSVGRKDREESSQWELSSSSGESVHSTTRSLTSAQDQATPTHSARGTCPESPGSYVARMQRTLLRMERSGGNANGNIDVNGKANRIANGNANVNANVNPNAYSSVNGQGNGQDCVGSGPTVWLEGNAAGRVDTHAAESTEQGTEESHQRGLDKRPGTHQDNYHEMDLMIAAVSTMIGMHIPEEARYVLLVACCAVIVLIPGRRWGLFDPCLWSASSSSAERDSASPDQGDSAAPAHGASLSDHRESEGMDAARVESRPPGDVSRGTAGQDVAAGEAAAGGAAAGGATAGGAAAGGAKVEGAAEGTAEEQGQQYASTKLYEEVLAGLSDVQLKFINSAGPEERDRLLLQCLEYANGDMQQATKVCSTFCNFRLTQGWGLVLSAAELEGPLRTRVHTLTEQTDRFGRGILTFSPGRLDMRNASPEAYHKMLCYVLQEVLKKQDFQKKGIVLLVDARGVGFGLLRHFVLADYKRGLGMLSGAFPAKLKAIRILHPNRALALALSIAMPLLSPKMRARVEIVAGDRAGDGSFSRNLADPSALPMELNIGGTWTGSMFFWDRWVAERLGRSK